MKRIEVLIPFEADGVRYEVGKEYEVPSEIVERALKLSVNMLLVLETIEKPKVAKPKKKVEGTKKTAQK